jgi:hypothetical protein
VNRDGSRHRGRTDECQDPYCRARRALDSAARGNLDAAASFAATEAIRAGEWDAYLDELLVAIHDRRMEEDRETSRALLLLDCADCQRERQAFGRPLDDLLVKCARHRAAPDEEGPS